MSLNLTQEMMKGLVEFKLGGFDVRPAIAQSWKMSNGGLTWTFTLRKNLKFSDGTPIDASAVKFNFDRWRLRDNPYHKGGDFSYYESQFGGFPGTIASVKALAPDAVEFDLTKSIAPFLADLAMPAFSISSPTALKDEGENYFTQPVGTGPYKFADFKPGDLVTGERNPNYHLPNRPYFDTIEMKGGGDAVSAARAVIQTGEFDYAWNMQVEDDILKRMEQGGKGRVDIVAGGNIEHIQCNFTDPSKEVDGERSSIKTTHPLLSDPAVRQALNLLVIAEAQFANPSAGSAPHADRPEPPSGVYKIGAWFNSENFNDQRFDNTGLSLANPASNRIPLAHHSNYGVYAAIDQMIWLDPTESDRNVNVFGRVLWAPQADRNLVTFGMNAGVTFHEPFMHRNNDTFSIGMGYAKVSSAVAALDRDTAAFTGNFVPTRGGETFFEVSYQYQVVPWWQLQPDLQYVINPGGGVANPKDPSRRIANEFIMGLRTTILF